MIKDKAIYKAMLKQEDFIIPENLRSKIVQNIYALKYKQRKRNYILSLILVSCVSVTITVSTFYLLVKRFELNFSFPSFDLSFPSFNLSFVANPILQPSIFLAIIISLLLMFDTVLRKKVSK